MKWHIILSLFFVHRAVIAKPGFDGVPELTLSSLQYQDETHRDYHLKKGVDFVQQQIFKTSQVNENIAKNAILFLGDGMVMKINATDVLVSNVILLIFH